MPFSLSLKLVKETSFKMVTKNQLEKNSNFLKSIRQAKDLKEVKKILISAGNSCLKVLLLVIKACVFNQIPLAEEDRQKLKAYKSKLRCVTELKSNKSRY